MQTAKQAAAMIVAFFGAIVLALALVAQFGCHSKPPALVGDAIDCGRAEADAIAAGHSVLDVANACDTAVSFAANRGFAATEKAIEALIVQYGEPIVACSIVRELAPPPSSAAAAQAPPTPGSPLATRQALAIAHQWKVK